MTRTNHLCYCFRDNEVVQIQNDKNESFHFLIQRDKVLKEVLKLEKSACAWTVRFTNIPKLNLVGKRLCTGRWRRWTWGNGDRADVSCKYFARVVGRSLKREQTIWRHHGTASVTTVRTHEAALLGVQQRWGLEGVLDLHTRRGGQTLRRQKCRNKNHSFLPVLQYRDNGSCARKAA